VAKEGIVRIVIDENGDVQEGSAALMSIVNEAGNVLPSGEIPETPIAWRTFQCPECERFFEARASRRIVHECEAGAE
jgi:hypothetical protein